MIMSRVGICGLACSISGLVLLIQVIFGPLISWALAMTGGGASFAVLSLALLSCGLGLGALGLLLGIIGALIDEHRAPGIVGIVISSLAILMALMFITK